MFQQNIVVLFSLKNDMIARSFTSSTSSNHTTHKPAGLTVVLSALHSFRFEFAYNQISSNLQPNNRYWPPPEHQMGISNKRTKLRLVCSTNTENVLQRLAIINAGQ
jgi:hypothetical protein